MIISLPTVAGIDRSKKKVDLIVIHAMAEYLEYEDQHYHARDFLNKIGLSCHYMITPSSGIIRCANPATRIAWHAKGYNYRSIGIELLVPGLHDYDSFCRAMRVFRWPQAQLNILHLLCAQLMNNFKMQDAKDHVKMHKTLDPGRKVDPGDRFNIDELHQKIDRMRMIEQELFSSGET